MTSDGVRPAGYRADIDGLRALAVMAVVAYHAGIPYVTGGFVGVDVFFVISGYLIGGIVDRDIQSGCFSFAGFYARRARRILPALVCILTFCYGAGALLLSPLELHSLARDAVATLLGISNIVFLARINYFSPPATVNPMLMTWSLGVEEQFYLLFPLTLIVINRWRPRALLGALLALTIASFVAGVMLLRNYPLTTFYLLPTRAWELGVGAVLALHQARRIGLGLAARPYLANAIGALGLLLIVVSIFAYDDRMPFPGIGAVLPVAGGAMLIAARQGIINRLVLSAKPVTFLGLISYSWYLWHWPLLAFARIPSAHALGAGTGLVIAIASCGMGVLSWRYVELPFRRSFGTTRVALRNYAFVMGLTLIPGGLMLVSKGWPQRFATDMSRIESGLAGRALDRCQIPSGVSSPNLSPYCVPPPSPVPAVAILGDSHAAALAPALRILAEQQGYRFVELAKSQCPSIAGLSRLVPRFPRNLAECAAYAHKADAIIEGDPTIKIVMIVGAWSGVFIDGKVGDRLVRDGQAPESVSPTDSRNNFIEGLDAAVARFQEAGKQVVLVKDVPLFDFDPLRWTVSDYIPARHLLSNILGRPSDLDAGVAPFSDILNDDAATNALIDRVAANHPPTRVLNLWDVFCAAGGCRFSDGRAPYYADFSHLNELGAKYALRGVSLALPGEGPS